VTVAMFTMLIASGATAFNVPTTALRAPTLHTSTLHMSAAAGDYQQTIANARARAAALKEDQDATAAVMAVGFVGTFALPLVDNIVLDLLLSSAVATGVGVVAGFRDDAAGNAALSVGKATSSAVGGVVSKASELDAEYKVSEKLGLDKVQSYSDLKAIGVAGVIAYILTELAFWAVAFPVASASFFNLNGHWPDYGDGADRTAVLAFIFAGANVARLVVPLRLAAALAITPWVDENVCKRFGIGGGDASSES